jgi:hypothetical protein
MKMFVLVRRVECQDDFYGPYLSPVWVGAEAPSQETILEVGNRIDREEVWNSHQMALVETDEDGHLPLYIEIDWDEVVKDKDPIRPCWPPDDTWWAVLDQGVDIYLDLLEATALRAVRKARRGLPPERANDITVRPRTEEEICLDCGNGVGSPAYGCLRHPWLPKDQRKQDDLAKEF